MSFFKVDCSTDSGNPPRTLSQSSAILVKVGYSSLQFVKVDCSTSQILSRKTGPVGRDRPDGRVAAAHSDTPLQSTLENDKDRPYHA